MNKLSKLTALLLALVLAIGAPAAVVAESETIETHSQYIEVADALLQLKIMAFTNYGEYWDFARLISESDFETFFFGLSEAEQNQMSAYVEGMFWDSLIAYTRVAPIHTEEEEVQPVSTFSVQSRGGDVATVAETDNGLYTNKTVSGPDDNGYYTITLENYATGTVTTNTTTTTKPVDIVLVLDFSKSMSQSFDSDSSTSGEYTYTAVDPSAVDTTETYYVSSQGGYEAVTYCSQCSAWHRSGSNEHNTKYYASSSDSGGSNTRYRIFYTRTSTSTDTDTETDTTIPSDATKIEALQIAVNNFIQNVNDQYTDTANHRISIVSYNSSATVRNDWTYASDANLTDLKMTDTERTSWQSTGTNTHLGLASALTQLNELTTDTTRQKVVVLFTDGVPGTSQFDFDESAAVTAVTNADSIKNTGAIVYSVAVLTDADPTATIDTSATKDDTKINAMLHAISSNYPDASASASGSTLNTTLGTINPLADTDGNGVINDGDKSYYLTADSPASLNNIFQQISSSIQTGASSVTLDDTTIVRDVVTPYFEIPFVYVYETNEDGSFKLDANGNKIPVYETNADGSYILDESGNKIQKKDYTAAEITIYEAAYTSGTDDAPVFGTPTKVNYTYTVDGNVLDVTGFDFSENAVMTVNGTRQGKKLIITFKIKAVDGFLGGNNVFTNTSDSGIWEQQKDGTYKEFEEYPIPNVSIAFKSVQINGANQYIYLSNYANLDSLLQSFDVRYTFTDGTTEYFVDGYRNGYAALRFKLTDPNNDKSVYFTILPGQTTGKWTYVSDGTSADESEGLEIRPFLENDHKYVVTYEVFAKEKLVDNAIPENTEADTTGSLDAWVYVFKPQVTFQDTKHKYTEALTADTVTNYYLDENYVATQTKWYNATLDMYSTERIMMHGPLPDLTFTFDPATVTDEVVTANTDGSGHVTTTFCVPVDVTKVTATSTYETTSTVDGTTTVTKTDYPMDVTAATTSYRQEIECDCKHNAETIVAPATLPATKVGDANIEEFVIHVYDVMGCLTITKQAGANTTFDPNETFIFTVKGTDDNNSNVDLTVTIKGAGSVTINNLLVGDYTVTEDLAWSWRYEKPAISVATDDSINVNSPSVSGVTVPGAGSVTVTFTNKVENQQWIDGSTYAENVFGDAGDSNATVKRQ